jgi:hypothetical protein
VVNASDAKAEVVPHAHVQPRALQQFVPHGKLIPSVELSYLHVMPLNVFKAFSGSRGDGEGFFRRGLRRSSDGPSIRRQVLTRGFRRNREVSICIL